MQCPKCHHNNSRVIDSRQADDGRVIRRRRECENCGYRFTTFERIEEAPSISDQEKRRSVKNLIVKKF
jgi:transcriptional repressor NrdR